MILETERLRLRKFRPDDVDELAAMVGDPEQMRFYPYTRTREDASAWLERNRALYERQGFGFWLVEDRNTSRFLGYCGIRPLELDGATVTEIGWHMRKTSWNRGLATEAATAVRDAAFARFAQSRLVALIPPANAASRRVAEKIGMREGEETLFDGVQYATFVYDAR
jgi:RimJ/RimL family protein N-acetyltransferase